MHLFMSWNLKVQIMKVETKFPHFSKNVCLLYKVEFLFQVNWKKATRLKTHPPKTLKSQTSLQHQTKNSLPLQKSRKYFNQERQITTR